MMFPGQSSMEHWATVITIVIRVGLWAMRRVDWLNDLTNRPIPVAMRR